MKLLFAAVLCSVLFFACSTDSTEEYPIVGNWSVQISQLTIKMEPSPNPENTGLLENGETPKYLSEDDFKNELADLLSKSKISFTTTNNFKVEYPETSLVFTKEPTSFEGTYKFSNGILEKYYHGQQANKTVTKSQMMTNSELVVEIGSKDEFLKAFGYEMPTIISKTTDDLVTDIHLKVVFKRIY